MESCAFNKSVLIINTIITDIIIIIIYFIKTTIHYFYRANEKYALKVIVVVGDSTSDRHLPYVSSSKISMAMHAMCHYS